MLLIPGEESPEDGLQLVEGADIQELPDEGKDYKREDNQNHPETKKIIACTLLNCKIYRNRKKDRPLTR